MTDPGTSSKRAISRIGEADESAADARAHGRTSDLDVRQLRAFVAVVREGTVGRAAASLGLAQSTVSEALAALDRALGAQTVQRKRGAQRMKLTAAGEALLPHATRTLEEIEAAHLSVASVTRFALARVDVVANESVSTYLLPPALGAVRKQWPRTRFAVSVATCATIRQMVQAGRCDLALVLEEDVAHEPLPTRNGTIERRDLRTGLPLVIFAGPEHPLARDGLRRAIPRAALAEFPIFMSDSAGDFHDLLMSYFAADGITGPRVEAAGTIEGVRREVASDSSALGVLPLYALADDLDAGRIQGLNVKPAPPRYRLVALLPSATQRHPALTDLIERLA